MQRPHAPPQRRAAAQPRAQHMTQRLDHIDGLRGLAALWCCISTWRMQRCDRTRRLLR